MYRGQGFYNAEAAKEVSRKQRKVLKAAKLLAEQQRLLTAAQIAGRRPVPETPDFAEDETVISPVFGAPVFGALALQSRPAAAVDPDELSDAQVIEFHARAIGGSPPPRNEKRPPARAGRAEKSINQGLYR